MSENEIDVVQVRMKKHTLEKLDRLKAVVKSPSRSDAVRRSLDISEFVINAIARGSQILVEDKKGKQQRILITGLNQ